MMSRRSPDRILVWVSLVAAVVWIVSILSLATPGFALSDDLQMEAFANGDYSGSSSHFLVFSNVIYGAALRSLYELAPGIPWYALLLYAVQALSIAAVFYVILRARIVLGNAMALLGIGWLVFTLPNFTIALSFTPTAILAGLAGVLLLISSLATPIRPFGIASAAGLLLVSTLIRGNAALLVLLTTSIFVARALLRTPRRVAAFTLVLLTVIPLGTMQFNDWYTGRPTEWADYNEFNALRGQLHGTKRLRYHPGIDPVLDRMGWTPLDLAAFEAWIFPDPQVFTAESLRIYLDNTQQRPPGRSLLADLGGVWNRYRPQLAAAIALLAWCLLRAIQERRTGLALWPFAALVGFVAPMIYLTLFERFPLRLGRPIWGLLPIFLLLEPRTNNWLRFPTTSSTSRRHHANRLRALMAGAVAAILAIGGITRSLPLSQEFEIRREKLQSSLEILEDVDPDGVFVYRVNDLLVTGKNPLSAHGIFHSDPKVIGLGWSTFSPPWNSRRVRFGLGNVLESVVSDPNVYLISDRLSAQLVRTFARRHYGISTTPVQVASIPVGDLPRDLRRPSFVWTFEPLDATPAKPGKS